MSLLGNWSREMPFSGVPNTYLSNSFPNSGSFGDVSNQGSFSTGGVDPSTPGQARSYAGWSSNYRNTANLRIRPAQDKSHLKLMQHDVIAVGKSMPDGGFSSSDVVLNWSQLNSLCRKADALMQRAFRGRVGIRSYENYNDPILSKFSFGDGTLHREDRNALLQFFSYPEPMWDRLYDPKNPILGNDEYKLLKFCTVAGLESLYYFGDVLEVGADNPYDTYELRDFTNIASGTSNTWGDMLVRNYWGRQAQAGSSLFIITKRVFDESTQEYGPMQKVPWAGRGRDSVPPESEMFYLDYSGAPQYGKVDYFGKVIDVRGNYPSESTRLKMLGMIGSAEEQFDASYNAPLLLVAKGEHAVNKKIF
jgi:hypothetical protein